MASITASSALGMLWLLIAARSVGGSGEIGGTFGIARAASENRHGVKRRRNIGDIGRRQHAVGGKRRLAKRIGCGSAARGGGWKPD